jgi:ATP-dependent DNA helicase RecG
MQGPGDISLTMGLEALPQVGTKRALALAALGVTNLGKLIAYMPMRHERLEAEAEVSELGHNQNVSTRGQVTATRVVLKSRRPRFEAVLVDPSGRLDLVWFNATYLRERIHPGMRIRVQGKARKHAGGLQLANPKWELIRDEAEPSLREERIRPVYPASAAISSAQIEASIKGVLPMGLPLIEDHLDAAFRRKRELPELASAYRLIHQPETEDDAAAGRRRLAYDELLLMQLGVHIKRAHLRETLKAPALRWSEAMDRHIRDRFPFALTAAQDAVVKDLVKDLVSATPTNRLIQGDVGSGKTVVALYAMLMAVASGEQAAIMAPTEILAEQHYTSISRMLEGSKVRVQLLTGATPGSERSGILERVASGEVDILVGTHSLITETVKFSSLAVVVIDEQHRFGVHQRAALRSKGTGAEGGNVTPHVLVMTATPIPRTIAVSLFGDLDISTIAGLPPGRQPIVTRVVGPEKREEVYAYIRQRLDKGEQAYIVVPTIEAGVVETGEEESGPGDVRTLLKALEEGELAGKRLAALHGRLKRSTREAIMERFRSGIIDALVATTVIEVGVDVPNATMMIVEHADRFGLAQLHQLRGRVGRSDKKSLCVLIADPTGEDAKERLAVMAKTTDGFALAERDLEIRGPGQVFGTRQAGGELFKIADLSQDLDLLKMARKDAAEWIAKSPHLGKPEEKLIQRRLVKTHGKWIGLGDVG